MESRAQKIYLVTHSGLTQGHQITQTAHVIAELAVAHPEQFSHWHGVSQSIIVLSAPSSRALYELYVQSLSSPDLSVVPFREPDLGDEITALAFLPSERTVHFLANLPLAGKTSATPEEAAHERRLKRESLRVQDSQEFRNGQTLRDAYLQTYATACLDGSVRPQTPTWDQDRAMTFAFLDDMSYERAYQDPHELDAWLEEVLSTRHNVPSSTAPITTTPSQKKEENR